MSLEIFLDALFCDAESASQGNFCKIIAVETRNVLFVGASDRLLRLHHFHRIGDTRAETIARLKQSLFRQVNVASRHVYQLRRRLQVQQRSANVGVDLRTEIIQALSGLLQPRIGLQNVSVDAASLKDGNRECAAHVEDLCCRGGMPTRGANVCVEGKRWEIS